MPQAAPAQPAGAPAEAEQPKWIGMVRSVAMFLAIQTAMSYGMKYLNGNKAAPPAPVVDTPSTTDSAAAAGTAVTGPRPMGPFWPLGTDLSMLLYTSTSPIPDVTTSTLVSRFDHITYGEWTDAHSADLLLDVPYAVRHGNASWWMDVVLLREGGKVEGRDVDDVAVYRKQLTRFLPKRVTRKEKNLLSAADEEEDEVVQAPAKEIVSHWSSNLTLNIISGGGRVDYNALPPIVSPHYALASGGYYPPVFPNDFWLLRENMWPINKTDDKLPLHVQYYPLSNLKFQMFASLGQGFDAATVQQGGGAEMDEVKRMFTETSPWLLITTALVTVLHMVFEFLAFSSDIGHWRKKGKNNDLVGVSLNTILTNCFVQFVVLLYLHDSSEETSLMILFTQGIGLAIEAWKITKVVNVRVRAADNLVGYRITFEDKKELTEEEKRTQEYDKLAFKLVSYAAIPMLGGYAVYSLMYLTHRSWYSFVVSTTAQAIYMFGFVQLVPQLIINYKLKSVAHMPMKAMMYKTLSTVVDDFFAFCVRMPWLHRLACFRDDVVFLILLYQRWIYRVDYSRVNEYGQVADGKVLVEGEEPDKVEKTEKSKKPVETAKEKKNK